MVEALFCLYKARLSVLAINAQNQLIDYLPRLATRL